MERDTTKVKNIILKATFCTFVFDNFYDVKNEVCHSKNVID